VQPGHSVQSLSFGVLSITALQTFAFVVLPQGCPMRAALWAGPPHLAHLPAGFCLLLMLALYYEDS
jgi:hypothetical protein